MTSNPRETWEVEHDFEHRVNGRADWFDVGPARIYYHGGIDGARAKAEATAKRISACMLACEHLEDVAALADLITSAAALTSIEKMKAQMQEKTYDGLRGAALSSLGDALQRLHG